FASYDTPQATRIRMNRLSPRRRQFALHLPKSRSVRSVYRRGLLGEDITKTVDRTLLTPELAPSPPAEDL
ncbi:hypothetical protein, partial [Sphingomonas faeni]|uniref:hypothetical protein n=1 Tax=Sphingomonas faeni TaxID=185950 RepID=UPI0020C8246D